MTCSLAIMVKTNSPNSPTGQQDPNMQSKVNAIYGH